jgi:hypothetical protein
MPRNAKRIYRAASVSLGGVIVDHVENDFDVGLVQGFHHLFELGNLGIGVWGAAVKVMRCEEIERHVSPVVPLLGQDLRSFSDLLQGWQ